MKELGLHATDLQKARLLEQESRLHRKIQAWQSIYGLYNPIVAALSARAERSGSMPDHASQIPLFLPSAIAGESCPWRLLDYEWTLQYAQAQDALDKVRNRLRIR